MKLSAFRAFPLLIFVLLVSCCRVSAQCVVNAKDYYRSGEYLKAIDILSGCNAEEQSHESIELLAYCYFLSGNLTEADKTISQIDDSLLTGSRLSIKARIVFSLGDYEKAGLCYNKLLETDSLNAGYLRQLAACYDKLDSTRLSMNYYAKALSSNPDDLVSGMRLAEKLLQQNMYTDADSLTGTLLNNHKHPELYKMRGDAMYALKEHAEAYACYEPLLRKGTSNPDLLRKAGISKFMNGETELAVQMLSVAHLVNPEDEITCYYLGLSYQSMKDYKASELFFKAAISNGISNNMGNYYSRLADMYETSGDYIAALEAYKSALIYSDKKPDLHHEVGRVYEVYLKDRKNALINYKKYLEMASDTATRQYRGVKGRVDNWKD
jgi:tetratricopeptide (TPR) repeat protein